ncbi:MAG: hypothetical protein Alpg2KO_08250 [Alphaproteobacteria bacterium]
MRCRTGKPDASLTNKRASRATLGLNATLQRNSAIAKRQFGAYISLNSDGAAQVLQCKRGRSS